MKLLLPLIALHAFIISDVFANVERCREETKTVIINNKAEQLYGIACQQPNGAWKMVSDYKLRQEHKHTATSDIVRPRPSTTHITPHVSINSHNGHVRSGIGLSWHHWPISFGLFNSYRDHHHYHGHNRYHKRKHRRIRNKHYRKHHPHRSHHGKKHRRKHYDRFAGYKKHY